MNGSCSLNPIEQLRALAKAKALTEDQFKEAVDEFVASGRPMAHVVEAIQGTEWCYVLENCGRTISVAHRGLLISWYGELLKQAVDHIESLDSISDGPLSVGYLLGILDAREQAGKACHEVALESRRIARYLTPRDHPSNARKDIARYLSPLGLNWDGDYVIESWPGENESLHERVAAMLKSGSNRADKVEIHG